MKTTTFRQPPAPATADDWMLGSTLSEKPARLTIDIPRDLHGRFKVACARERTKMRDVTLASIKEWTQEHEP